MTPNQLQILRQIRYKLSQAYKEADRSQFTGKSSEGWIRINYATIWDDLAMTAPAESIEIYSYELGPARMHSFSTFEEALEAVKGWCVNSDWNQFLD